VTRGVVERADVLREASRLFLMPIGREWA
jgi:hypothetical protein